MVRKWIPRDVYLANLRRRNPTFSDVRSRTPAITRTLSRLYSALSGRRIRPHHLLKWHPEQTRRWTTDLYRQRQIMAAYLSPKRYLRDRNRVLFTRRPATRAYHQSRLRQSSPISRNAAATRIQRAWRRRLTSMRSKYSPLYPLDEQIIRFVRRVHPMPQRRHQSGSS